MYKCTFCGKEYENRYSYLGHCSTHSRRGRKGRKKREILKNCKFCNKYFENPLSLGGHVSSCEMNPNKDAKSKKMSESGKGRVTSIESKKKISNSMKKAHKEGKAWNIGKSRWNNKQSYPEKFFTKVINNEFFDKDFIPEFPIGIYSLDFAWTNKKKAIEIDGEQHERFEEYIERDKRKDIFVKSEGWEILRIKWKDMHKDTKNWISIANNYIGN